MYTLRFMYVFTGCLLSFHQYKNHNLSLFSHTGPLSEMLLFWNQWYPFVVAAMDESKVRRGFISATFYFLRPHQMSLTPTESVLSAQPSFTKYGL